MRMSLMCKQKGQSPSDKEILNSNLKRPSSEPKVAAATKYLNQLGREPHPTSKSSEPSTPQLCPAMPT
ncbi:hypothetical protein NC653_031951 [Populus alba x Populus x berolinensis]|uniref:Uncharacterized protein n=1 Tax=Populus alba x Populus x berolinensis TaxID=444605 RepID=A0AAD6Q3C2_9ROSI|nr:hypothetical protein NC653_031951 [Populus alba x Populus x berolinensis]